MFYSDQSPAMHPEERLWNDIDNDLNSIEKAAYSPVDLIDLSLTSAERPRSLRNSRNRKNSTRDNTTTSSSVKPWSLISESDFPPLVDLTTPPSMIGDQVSFHSSSIVILQSDANGLQFSQDGIKIKKILTGTLMKPISELDSFAMHHLREYSRSTSDIFARDVVALDVYAVLKSSDVMRLTDDQALLLLAVSTPLRLHLYHDLGHFHFVEHLRVGDTVCVEREDENSCLHMYTARVTKKGERPKRLGTWFEVEIQQPPSSMNGSEWSTTDRLVYKDAAHLYKPISSTVPSCDYRPRNVEVRTIPIRRIETVFDTDNTTSTRTRPVQSARVLCSPQNSDAFARDLCNWDGDPRTVNEPLREWHVQPRVVEDKLYDRTPTPRSRQSSMNSSQPSRSQSAHVVTAYDKTFSVDDVRESNGARVGDRCVWKDGNRNHKGYIRFIGHLKGHTNLYAGIEFDDAVGKGTGVYLGETVFQTPENRAGFVVISSLQVIADSKRHRPLHVRHKQASAESLSDPPLPPLPPKPVMRPEDYLIESFPEGSYVEVCHLGACRSGVVRWLGDAMSEDNDHLERSAVVELDDDIPYGWRLAPSTSNNVIVPRGVLVPTATLRRDRRFNSNDSDDHIGQFTRSGKQDFGSIDSGIETSRCEPWKSADDLIGRMKGIQGHRNSCYLDATLYAMFVQSNAFDSLLERPAKRNDIPQYSELVRLLSTEIVYPLRKFHYVRADHIMKVRQLLAEILPNVKGLTSEEKDPEEILGQLFGNILNATPFLELINNDHKIDRMFICPLVVDDWQGGVATTQHLLEHSIKSAGVKFAVPPKTLIVQLPRYGQQKVFDKILPLEKIDITALIQNTVLQCACGRPADGMCPECFLCKRVFITEVSFCQSCFHKAHLSSGELDHVMKHYVLTGKPNKKPVQHRMTLSAVLCIETSHYVAFVRTPSGRWVFFDSMADREGLSDGYNVPQVKECDRMSWWLSQSGWERLRNADENGSTKIMLGKGSDVDPLVTRLLSDSYICFYQQDTAAQSTSSSSIINNVIQKMVKL